MSESKRPRQGVMVESSRELPIVDLYIVSETGAAHDPKGREGSLNLALRTLRRGTRHRSAREVDVLIDRLGAELSTSTDPTSSMLHATVIRRNLVPFLDLMADLLGYATFPDHEAAQVSREIRAEIIDGRDDDRTLAGRHFRRSLFTNHPFGRPSAGTPRTLEEVTRDDAVSMWNRTFRQENVILAASGDITDDEMNGFATRVFPTLRKGPLPAREVPDPAPVKGRNLVIVDKPGRSQTQIYIGNLGSHPRDRDHVALHVANTIFGGTFTARLMNEIRSKRGWSYGASSRMGRDRAREAWSMWTFPSAADAPACVALQLKMLEHFVNKGVTARELSFARSYLARSFAFEIDTASKRLWHRIDTQVLDLPKRYFTDQVERVMSVTLDEVNAAIRHRLSSDDLLITVVATASEIRKRLEDAIPHLASTRIIPFDTD